jgi:hypothetical protein
VYGRQVEGGCNRDKLLDRVLEELRRCVLFECRVKYVLDLRELNCLSNISGHHNHQLIHLPIASQHRKHTIEVMPAQHMNIRQKPIYVDPSRAGNLDLLADAAQT